MLIKRIGYQKGAVTGLMIAASGCALFYPAATSGYGVFLLAFFVLASGITILQVAANPYVTELGDPQTASSKLTLTQAFNSLGTTVAPTLGGMLILGGVVLGAAGSQGAAGSRAACLPGQGSGDGARALPGTGRSPAGAGRAVRAGTPAEDHPRRA
ncbi:hypothetical protein LP420_15865 [Massilia sp. B-10]|nr:hypothetical protein LP420_15865 [Massilia sp. B-10]